LRGEGIRNTKHEIRNSDEITTGCPIRSGMAGREPIRDAKYETWRRAIGVAPGYVFAKRTRLNWVAAATNER
jgi:hypothetical protein